MPRLQLGRHDKLAGCGERALTGRPEPCNRGVGPGIRMEPVKRPHYKRPKRFQPGAFLYRTQTIQHRLIFSGSLHSCGGRYFVFSNPFEIIYFHSPPYSYLFLIFPFFLAAPIFYSLRLC